MADLTDIQSALPVKIAGANPSTGVEDNFMEVDISGNAQTLVNNGSGGSAVNIQDGGNSITIDQSTASNLNAQVVGNVASAASDSGNPVKVGGVYNSTLPTFTNGQRGDIQLTTRGAQIISGASPVGSAPIDPPVSIAGIDEGGLKRGVATDTSGRLKLAGSSFFHPTFTLRVQAVTGSTGSATTSLVIPISSTSSGNFIAVMVSSSTAATVTVTDNLAQSYSTAISGTSGTHTNYIFYKANTASGVTTITISATINSGLNSIVTEYFGVSTSSPLDKTSTATVVGASAFTSIATSTTTSAIELLLGSAHGVTKNNQTYTPGTSWSSVGTSNGFNAAAGQLYVEDQYVSVVGSYTATGTASGNDTIIGNIATFVVTNTNLAVVNQPKVIKSGAGVLRKLIINGIGTAGASVTFYDNTTNSGTIIATVNLTGAVTSIPYDLYFSTGLTMVINSTSSDITITYD